jgi:hypothetical protein
MSSRQWGGRRPDSGAPRKDFGNECMVRAHPGETLQFAPKHGLAQFSGKVEHLTAFGDIYVQNGASADWTRLSDVIRVKVLDCHHPKAHLADYIRLMGSIEAKLKEEVEARQKEVDAMRIQGADGKVRDAGGAVVS